MATIEEFMHQRIHKLINEYHHISYRTHDYKRQPIKMNMWCEFCPKDSELLINPKEGSTGKTDYISK